MVERVRRRAKEERGTDNVAAVVKGRNVFLQPLHHLALPVRGQKMAQVAFGDIFHGWKAKEWRSKYGDGEKVLCVLFP